VRAERERGTAESSGPASEPIRSSVSLGLGDCRPLEINLQATQVRRCVLRSHRRLTDRPSFPACPGLDPSCQSRLGKGRRLPEGRVFFAFGMKSEVFGPPPPPPHFVRFSCERRTFCPRQCSRGSYRRSKTPQNYLRFDVPRDGAGVPRLGFDSHTLPFRTIRMFLTCFWSASCSPPSISAAAPTPAGLIRWTRCCRPRSATRSSGNGGREAPIRPVIFQGLCNAFLITRAGERKLPAKPTSPPSALAGNFFAARLLGIMACRSQKVPRHAIALISQPPNELADGRIFAIVLQSQGQGGVRCNDFAIGALGRLTRRLPSSLIPGF